MSSSYKKLAVLGHPILQSRSPFIHNYWIKKYGLQGHYEAIDIPPDALHTSLKDLISAEYEGFNVTTPHKQSIRDICDVLDTAADEIGAVNTLHWTNNKLYGSNTDAYGFTQNLENTYSDFNWTNATAIILGAGGAARAVTYALKEKNVPIIKICNRTLENAQKISDDIAGQAFPWGNRQEILKDANLLINTTLLGMKGQASLDIPLQTLPSDALVYDLVYAPLMTPLLQEAQSRGNPIVTGIGMLLYQAQKSFEIWYGLRPDIDIDLIQNILGTQKV